MKQPSTNWPVWKFIAIGGLAVPTALALIFTVLFCVACWLGDGTLAYLYTVDYFMPMPFYILGIWMWTLLIFVPSGVVVGACVGLVAWWKRTKGTEQHRGQVSSEGAPSAPSDEPSR